MNKIINSEWFPMYCFLLMIVWFLLLILVTRIKNDIRIILSGIWFIGFMLIFLTLVNSF